LQQISLLAKHYLTSRDQKRILGVTSGEEDGYVLKARASELAPGFLGNS